MSLIFLRRKVYSVICYFIKFHLPVLFFESETEISALFLLFIIGLVKKVTGGCKITFHPEGPDGPAWEADFSRPFKRFDMMTDLEREIGISLPKPDQLDTEGYQALMQDLTLHHH